MTDRERLDAIKITWTREQLERIHALVDALGVPRDVECHDGSEPAALWLTARLRLAADRLAALEHERDELRAELAGTLSEAFQAVPACYDTPADHYREMARRLVEDRDVQKHCARNAEAALLSLQTALKGLPRYDLVEYADYHEDDRMVLTDEGYWVKADDVAALLPDPAGTPSPKHDDDDQARVDRDTQAATDRNYRVQQNGEK